MKESEVLTELNYSLSEWGLGQTGHLNRDEHGRLRAKITHAVLAMLNERLDPVYCDFGTLINNKFPNTVEQAYEHVLRNDDMGNFPLFICHDSIKTSFEPFRRNSHDHREVSHYLRKAHFEKFQLTKLDPLNRFQFERVSKAELFFHRWFVESDDSRQGVFMEAAIACHAIHHEKCYHCKRPKALRWKGGSADAWQDLVCTKCETIYEVKTKKDMDKVNKAFESNRIPAGSFRAACRLENSRPSSKKRYLVLLPRNAFNKMSGNMLVHPVQVEEISKILPAACEYTFNEQRSSIAIRSVVSVQSRAGFINRNSTRLWFDLPKADCSRPLEEIAKKVFLERFSEEEYERFNSKYFETSPILPPEEPSNPSNDTDRNLEPSAMEMAIQKLAKLGTPDDWEDLDDSDKDLESDSDE